MCVCVADIAQLVKCILVSSAYLWRALWQASVNNLADKRTAVTVTLCVEQACTSIHVHIGCWL